jgi:pantoate--beta-alanine ligase
MAKLFTTLPEFINHRQEIENNSIGLVPTMGNLHDGHLSLIKKSLEENDKTIVTIFVNPKQFGPNEDFEKYPRTLEKDIEKINTLSSDIIVLAPKSTLEIYPKNFNSVVSVKELTNSLCGSDRPGHFDGVTTIVYRLFAITKAHNAYFGQKDFQQLQVIKRMAEDLLLPINIKMLPIHREESGLAMSSRNQFLSEDQRVVALNLSKSILEIKSLLEDKTYSSSVIELNSILEKELKDKNWIYLEILDSSNLGEININTSEVIIAGAYKVGDTRLIDNSLVKIQYA